MQKSSKVKLFITLAMCCIPGCSDPSDKRNPAGNEPENGIVTVYVVNYPLKYFAERIGGEHVQAVFPAPPNEDPAFWTPDTETITKYQQADLILLNGASYANWTRTVSLPETKTVVTSASASDRYITVADAVTHTHGPGGEHAHTDTAFTTWLDPRLALAQARAIRDALTKRLPQNKADFQANFAALEADLNDLDKQLSAIVKGKSNPAIFFSHPVYQYLQQHYNLNAKSVHWEPEEVPSQTMREELAAELKQHPAKWMVWEGAPIDQNVKLLEELGLKSTIYDPCGNAPDDGDYLTVMKTNVANLAQVFGD